MTGFHVSARNPAYLFRRQMTKGIIELRSSMVVQVAFSATALARILHELPELSVDFTSAAWLIVCRSIAIAMVQAGSAGMCRAIRRQTGSGTLCISYQTWIMLHLIEITKQSSKVQRNSCNMRAKAVAEKAT